MHRLHRQASRSGRWTPKIQKWYDHLDQMATDTMLKAEDNCARLHPRAAPWSVELMRASISIKYWNLKISSYHGGKTSDGTMSDIRNQAHLNNFTSTEEEAKTERIAAKKLLKTCLFQVEEIRKRNYDAERRSHWRWETGK